MTIDLDAAAPAAARRRRQPMLAGTVVAVTLLVAVAVLTRGEAPAVGWAGDPAVVLRAAAAAADRIPDPALADGQALLVATRQFTLEVTPGGADEQWAGVDQLVQEWIPAERRGTWLQRVQQLGPARPPAAEWRGRCGDYYPDRGRDSCARPGLWQEPTAAFVAQLPRDPRALLLRLAADVAGDETAGAGTDPGQEMLVFAAQALDRGLLPHDVRAAVYRALALLSGIRVLPEPRTPDGRGGVAVGLQARGAQVAIVVDPTTGAYLGRCRTLVTAADGLPPGTVTDATSLRTRVVSAVGRRA